MLRAWPKIKPMTAVACVSRMRCSTSEAKWRIADPGPRFPAESNRGPGSAAHRYALRPGHESECVETADAVSGQALRSARRARLEG
jgi:hypothetical protein